MAKLRNLFVILRRMRGTLPTTTVGYVSIRWATLATYVGAAAGVVMATLAGILSGSTHGSARSWWIVAACIAACVAFGVPALDRLKSRARARRPRTSVSR